MSNPRSKQAFRQSQSNRAAVATPEWEVAMRSAPVFSGVSAGGDVRWDEGANAIMGTPAPSGAALAQKLAILAQALGLCDPAGDILSVSRNGSPAERAFLACVLDAKALDERPDAPAPRNGGDAHFMAKVSTYDAAVQAFETPGQSEDGFDAAFETMIDAGWEVVRSPAPSLPSLIEKARVGIEVAYADKPGDAADNLVTIQRMLEAPRWDEGAVPAAIYTDLLRLSGVDNAITRFEPETFCPGVWLEDEERESGARLGFDRTGHREFTGSPEAQAALRAAIEGLPTHRRQLLEDHLAAANFGGDR